MARDVRHESGTTREKRHDRKGVERVEKSGGLPLVSYIRSVFHGLEALLNSQLRFPSMNVRVRRLTPRRPLA